MNLKFSLPAAFLMSLTPSAFAVSFDSISYWVGAGSQRAALVIDFNDGQTPRSYVWGFRWNGTATGEDMLRAVALEDSRLELDTTTFSGFGAALDAVRYRPLSAGGFRHNGVGSTANTRYWSYWSSSNGSTTWAFANFGMSARTLTNNDVDGWALSNPNYDAIPPTTPVNAVPEPATLAAIGVGVAAILRRRRRN